MNKKKSVSMWILTFGLLLLFNGASVHLSYAVHEKNQGDDSTKLVQGIREKIKEGDTTPLLLSQLKSILGSFTVDDDTVNNTRFLGACLAIKMGDYKQALEFFKNIKIYGKYSQIQDYIYYWWGKSLWVCYKNEKNLTSNPNIILAGKYFKYVADMPLSPLKKRAFLDYIRLSHQTGDYSILNQLPKDFLDKKSVIDPSSVPEILYILGNMNQKRGDRKKSIECYVELWKKYPSSLWAEKSEQELNLMQAGSVLKPPALSLGEFLNAVDSSIEKKSRAGNTSVLLANLSNMEKFAQGELRDRMNLLYGKIYYYFYANSSKNKDSLKRKALNYLTVAYTSVNPDIKCEAAYFLVNMAFRVNRSLIDYAKIKQIVTGIDDPRYLVSKHFEKTVYSAGYPFMLSQRYKEAIYFFSKVMGKPRLFNPYYDEALWRLHWCYYHTGKYPDALKALEELGQFDNWVDYSFYWRAYILRKIGRRDDAVKTYKSLLNNGVFTYYGMLAREDLKNDYGIDFAGDEGRIKFEEPKEISIDNSYRRGRFEILKELGLFQYAAQELEMYLVESGISREGNYERWRPFGNELARLYYYTGRYVYANTLLEHVYRGYLTRGVRSLPDWFWKIYYPVHYREIIEKYAKSCHVDSLLVYSLIRQESVFNPAALSSAGAMGVMQIMPGTGKQIYDRSRKGLGIDFPGSFTKEMLYKPEVNIPLGIYYLEKSLYASIEGYIKRKGLTRLDNARMKTTLMIAGYNAGLGRAYDWIKDLRYANDQEFIDQIDISETRQYVKSIRKHRLIYERIVLPGMDGGSKN